MKINTKNLLLTAAVTGLLASNGLYAANPGQAADGTSTQLEEKKSSCAGKDGCKGKDKKDDKKKDSDKSSCSGKSGCEGKDKK